MTLKSIIFPSLFHSIISTPFTEIPLINVSNSRIELCSSCTSRVYLKFDMLKALPAAKRYIFVILFPSNGLKTTGEEKTTLSSKILSSNSNF